MTYISKTRKHLSLEAVRLEMEEKRRLAAQYAAGEEIESLKIAAAGFAREVSAAGGSVDEISQALQNLRNEKKSAKRQAIICSPYLAYKAVAGVVVGVKDGLIDVAQDVLGIKGGSLMIGLAIGSAVALGSAFILPAAALVPLAAYRVIPAVISEVTDSTQDGFKNIPKALAFFSINSLRSGVKRVLKGESFFSHQSQRDFLTVSKELSVVEPLYLEYKKKHEDFLASDRPAQIQETLESFVKLKESLKQGVSVEAALARVPALKDRDAERFLRSVDEAMLNIRPDKAVVQTAVPGNTRTNPAPSMSGPAI